MKFPSVILVLAILISCSGSVEDRAKIISEQTARERSNITQRMQSLKEAFVAQRFGMFICYNIMSFGAGWGEANYPIASFNPQRLDANEWAQAALSANMKFGLLTTKHHEGFCLWDSKYTEYDVAASPYKKDIVRQYVDAFRKNNLGVGLYYSIWDSTHEVDKEHLDEAKLAFIKGQITELLTNYGKIDYFVIDGWYWKIGHKDVPYHEIRELIRRLQPDCLITDHTHLQAPYHMEIPYFEGPFGAFPPPGNTMASALGHCSIKGNGWFWSEDTPDGLIEGDGIATILEKLNTCERRYCNFMLNCMPNRDGALDPIFTDLLNEIGKQWTPDESRPKLPEQSAQIIESYPIQSVTASSGVAEYLFDARQVGVDHFHWEAEDGFPQFITIDLGEVKQDLNTLLIVPNHRCKPAPETALAEGNLTSAKLFVSSDNITFKEVAIFEWEPNAKYKTIEFEDSNARYLRLDILDANGANAIIAELEVGRSE